MFFGGKAFTMNNLANGSLAGRIIFITGGNGGLGKESALQLCRKGAKVYIGARTESKALAAVEEIKSKVPEADIHYIPLDLTSFTSIKSAVDTFLSLESSLHVLMNNAGIMFTDYSTTKEGYEIQFGTNHMGHFLLTRLLLPTLQSTAKTSPEGTVRIVNLSSAGHNLAFRGIPFDNISMKNTWTQERYGVAKLANVLHARTLAKRYTSDGIISVSLHPGVIASDLYTPYTDSNFILRNVYKIWKRTTTSIADGALNQIYCAASPEVTLADSGEYYAPVAVKGGGLFPGVSRYTKDEKMADKLWEFSEGEVKKHGY